MHIKNLTRLLVSTAMVLYSATDCVLAQVDQFFDGKVFDLKKLADSDAIGSAPIPQSAKLWMKLQTIYDDSNSHDSDADKLLIAHIKHDQEINKYIRIDNVWNLFANRMSERRFSDANSCITLAQALVGDDVDSAASKTLQADIKLLEVATGNKLHGEPKRGHLAVSNVAESSVPGHSPGSETAFVVPTATQHALGYTGIRLLDGKLDTTIQFSPAAKLKVFHQGDQIVSINGVPVTGMSTRESWQFSSGHQGEISHIIYIHKGQQKAVDIKAEAYPSLEDIDQMTAQEKFELGSQLRELGNMTGARIAFEQAALADPSGEYGTLATKALRSRMGRYNAPKRCIDIYMRAYFGNFDHEEVKAEALFRYCINEWPLYELPYRQLAGLLMKDGRLHEAESVLKQLFVVNPDYARGWILMANIKSRLGDKQSSLSCWKKAKELDPGDASLQ